MTLNGFGGFGVARARSALKALGCDAEEMSLQIWSGMSEARSVVERKRPELDLCPFYNRTVMRSCYVRWLWCVYCSFGVGMHLKFIHHDGLFWERANSREHCYWK